MYKRQFLERSKKENTGAKQDGRIGRIVNVFVATLLFLFGLTFTLIPYFIYRIERDSSDDPIILLFMIAFSIPFFMFGLFVLSIARGMMRGEWKVAGANETNSERWWDGKQP